MKALKRILYSLLVLIVLVLIAGFVILTGIKRKAIPKYKGEISLSGLSGNVTVYRDEKGMPHIYANDEHDLYFAVGYVMSQERLWQMDFLRRLTAGRLSEIIGEDAVDFDMFNRSLDIVNKSKMLLSNTEESIVNCLQAFADGVNEFISNAGNKLPPEFKILRYKPDPWKIEDICNILGYMSWDLASDNLYSDIYNYELVKKVGTEKANQLIPDWKADTSTIFTGFSLDEKTLKQVKELIGKMDKIQPVGINIFSGSNNWAVTGRKTTTGKPLFSNDMHLAFGAPGIWMQMHQVIPGKLNVTGVVVPCQPFVVGGHNEKIAWGETNLGVDNIDLFIEKINPVDSNQYFFNGEWKNMIIRDEVIKIKGGTEKIRKLRFTHRGTIISDLEKVNGAVISMRWSGYDMSNEMRTVYLLNRASNWDEFRSAISTFRSASQNFAYADVDGNIGINTGGGIPIRKGNGTLVRNGETEEFDWKGYVPFEQLPSSFNPETGFVSSANNKTVSDSYPYYIGSEFALPYRINRIRQMLTEKEVYGIEDFKRMVLDQHSDYASLLIPQLLKAVDKAGVLTPSEQFAINSFGRWDYDMNKDLSAPTIFEFFRESLGKNLLSDELGDIYKNISTTIREYYIYKVFTMGPDEWIDDINTPAKETLEEIIIKSFKDGVVQLSSVISPDTTKWVWGDIHKIIIEHPLSMVKILDKVFKLNSKEYRIGGAYHTVSPYAYEDGFKIVHGASERHIFNTADWDESYTVIPTGNSGVPASEFYMSQTDSYINGKFYKDPFTEPAVKAAAKYTLILKPGKLHK
jgi:penicillin G amidase